MHAGRIDPGAHHRELVSIVLATFNGEKYLAKQLASLTRQTRLPDELVVVDDGSTDGTRDILKQFARTAPFPVELIALSQRLGTCEAFGDALARASGDILVICDQDDQWLPDKLAVMAERMAQRPDAMLAFSDATLIDAEDHFLSRSRWRVAGFGTNQQSLMTQDPFGQMIARQIVSGCTAAIRRPLLPALLPFPAGIHPALGTMMYDRWISLLGAATGPVLLIPERLVAYRIHPDQQIGIPGLRIRRVVPRAALQMGQFVPSMTEKRGRLAYHVAHIDEIEKRLTATGLDTAESLLRLKLARTHLRTRESLTHKRAKRASTILHHYLEIDGYRRFSLGTASALSDLIR